MQGHTMHVYCSVRLEWCQAPANLFESPRTRFVANFLAEANIVDGQLRRVAGEMGEVDIAGHLVRMPHRGHAAGKVAVAIRPGAETALPPGTRVSVFPSPRGVSLVE